MKSLVIPIGCALITLGAGSCVSTDGVKNAQEGKYSIAWENKFGKVDPNQTWNGAVSVSVKVTTGGETAKVTASTLGEENKIVLGEKEINGSGLLSFDLPQGIGEYICVAKESATGNEYKRVKVSDLKNGAAEVVFSSNGDILRTPALKADASGILNGTPLVKNWGYSTFPGWAWQDINEAMPESSKCEGQITNYDLISKGKFYISTIFGNTGTGDGRVIGYYYYTGGSYSTLVYVPIVEVLNYDFFNGMAKTQWRRVGETEWHDTNYDAFDKMSGYTNNNSAWKQYRAGDDTFLCYDVNKNVGTDIDAVRGCTFQVDAPEGARVGFYIECQNSYKNDAKTQWDYLNQLGVPNLGSRNNWKLRNHSTRDLQAQKHNTSIIKIYDGFRFIGLEDANKGGDSDCNDVVFGMVRGNDGTLPGVKLPDIFDKDDPDTPYYNPDGTKSDAPKTDEEVEKENLQTWTMGFEDMGTIGDFDFNDVVIRVTPDPEKQKAYVTLCATGGAHKSTLYYNGQLIGEVHELLGVSGVANTNGKLTIPVKEVATVDWPTGYTMQEKASLFYIMTQDVNGKDVKVTIPTSAGETPHAICVPGKWQWPKENVCISDAYTVFGKWGANYNNPDAWNWYQQPTTGKVVEF